MGSDGDVMVIIPIVDMSMIWYIIHLENDLSMFEVSQMHYGNFLTEMRKPASTKRW